MDGYGYGMKITINHITKKKVIMKKIQIGIAVIALLFIGIGISIYGLIYFLIHDVYIHQRFKWFRQLDNKYSRAILRAHGAHHAKTYKDDGESFGLLIVNPKYFSGRTKKSA